MKISKKTLRLIIIVISLVIFLATCENNSAETINQGQKSTGQIYLYGEQHGVQKIMERQLELWGEYYHNENMRHLFVEYPYYAAEFLNIWIKSDNDDILDELYDDWAGTQGQIPYTKEFYSTIKTKYPETVFHGTDIGHQYNTTGGRFLQYLEENALKGSERYLLVQEVIEQGKYFYGSSNRSAYRETKMTENFIREFDKLAGENIMGIYGSAHVQFGNMQANSFTAMAERLRELYGNAVHLEDLSLLAQVAAPQKTDMITVGGKEYEALYFGEQDLTGFKNFVSRKFWRLENTYVYFKDNPTTGDKLPYNNYPMQIETGQVFVIDYTMTDGSVTRKYYRSDGNKFQDRPTTEEFKIGGAR